MNWKMKVLSAFVFILAVSFSANAQNLNNPNKEGPLGTQVNTLSGNLYLTREDFSVAGRGFDMHVVFSYNSYDFDVNLGFGNGWNFYYHIFHRTDSSGNKMITWGDGREDKYTLQPDGTYKAPVGFFDKMTQYQPGKFLLATTFGLKYYFDDPLFGKLTKMEDENGNFIVLNYTDSLLTSLVNRDGQTVSFSYDSNGQLAAITDAMASPTRTYTFNYDNVQNLTTVTDPLNNKFKYSYLTNGPMKTLTDRNGNLVNIIYYPNFAISEIVGCNKRISLSYDTLNNTTTTIDHLENGDNQITAYKYEKFGGFRWITEISGNCCGYDSRFTYDEEGNLITATDANGNVTRYTHDALGNVLTVTNPLGQVVTYTYLPNSDKIATFRDLKGNLYTLTYDSKGNLTQLTEPGAQTYSVSYNAKGDILTSTDPKGNVFTYSYDAYGNLTAVSGPEGYTASYSYDARGYLSSLTDARGNTTNVGYDILGRLKQITDPINKMLQYSYDANGNPVSLKNQLDQTSTLQFDASNRLVGFTDPMGSSRSISYDGMDNMKIFRDASGNETRLNYDSRNRLVSIQDANGDKTRYSYDARGNLKSVQRKNGGNIEVSYDQLHRINSITDENGPLLSLTYEANGKIATLTNGTGATVSLLYDDRSRVIRATDPVGNSLSYTYDANDNVISVTDRNGFTSHLSYDNLNRVKTFTDNNGGVIQVGYDASGNVSQLTDQNNNVTTYTYDELNRRKKMTFADGSFTENFYDARGNIISYRRTDGSTVSYQYDHLGRLTGKTLPDGQVFSYTYDEMGRVLTATNEAGTVSFTYDNLGRITSESFNGRMTNYAYEIAGRTQTITYPDGSIVQKEFDTRNRVTRVTKDGSVIAEYVYNTADQMVKKTLGNGITTLKQYDFANRLSNITSGNFQNLSFTYDKEGNKTAVIRNNNPSLSEEFVYDKNYRLTGYKRGTPGGTPSLNQNFSYDALGNRVSENLNGTAKNYTINNLNQITSVTGATNATFQYDSRGNLIYDGIFHKKYDKENRLIQDSSNAANVVAYQYDALNRRIAKWINNQPLRYGYSGPLQIEERDGSDMVLNTTVFSEFLSPVLRSKAGETQFFHQDHLNSVAAMSDASGNLLEQYRYEPFGKSTVYDASGNLMAGSLTGNHFRFTGQEYDSISGSYRFFYRSYSPQTGTFDQRDPLEYDDGLGMYQYVGNNPANGVDPWGLKKTSPQGSCEISMSGIKKEVITWVDNVLTINDGFEIVKITNVTTFLTPIMIGVNASALGDLYTNNIQNWNNLTPAQQMETIYSLSSTTSGFTTGAITTASATSSLMSGTGLMGGATAGSGGVVGGTLFAAGGVAGGLALYAVADQVFKHTAGDGKSLIEASYDGFFDETFLVEDMRYVLMGWEERKAISETEELRKWHKERWDQAERQMMRKIEWHKKHPGKCPPPGGTRKPPKPGSPGPSGKFEIISAKDPNEILGPEGQPHKKWMSSNDRLAYTILYENSIEASAPAKFVRITTPVEPKQDPATLQLGNFGFNSTTFSIKPGTAAYYSRVDARDSIGLYIDVTAGYDQMNNVVFWEFQSIDPLTLMPPNDPLKGFLLLQDSANQTYGHGFVTFSMKPKENAQTLDTIGARAEIVFDKNEMIPTNIHTNTLDAVAPQTQMVSATADDNKLTLTWSGMDDANGSGLDFYTLYISTDGENFGVFQDRMRRTDTTFTVPPMANYCFFVLGTDSVGNAEALRAGVNQCVFAGGVVPVNWMYFNGKNQGTDNVLTWATASEQNSNRFEIERSLTGSDFRKIGSVKAAGSSKATKDYSYTDRNIDRLNSERMYYRLKQIDNNEQFIYSNIVRLSYKEEVDSRIIVYPNPTDGQVTLSFSDSKLIGTWVSVYDDAGRLVTRVKITSQAQKVDLRKYVNGVYLLRFENHKTLRVIKH